MTMPAFDEADREIETKRLFQALEPRIRELNRMSIGDATGGVTEDALLQVAATISELRAQYLKGFLAATGQAGQAAPSHAQVAELRRLREAYEEAMHGFAELRHAMSRGYIDLPG